MKGIYSLIIEVKRPTTIKIGSLGKIRFFKGYYVYTGSAFNNLEARIARHLRKKKRLRWHVDYLLASPQAEISWIATKRTSQRLECKINKEISRFALSFIKKFGCSDCSCESHLYYFKTWNSCVQVLKKLFSFP